jgi:hypothetical protein
MINTPTGIPTVMKARLLIEERFSQFSRHYKDIMKLESAGDSTSMSFSLSLV